MNLQKNSARLLCLLLAAMLASQSVVSADGADELVPGQSGSGQEEASAPYQKTETVYVNLDPSGKPRQQIVTDWLHTDTPDAVLRDRSTLTQVENVKGTTQPQRQGSDLVWEMEGSDLYYRGQTDGQLPVEIQITYRLDGKEYDPEELAGRSGQLEMTVSVRNTQKHTVQVDGKSTTMYTPVTAAFALALPEEHFSNVSVSDGTVQSDGGSHAVAFVAMPGLSESLGLSDLDLPVVDQLDLPEEFVIRAQVTDFEMGPMGVLVSTGLSALDGLEDDADIDDMIADLDALSQSQDDLESWDSDGSIRSLFRDQQLTEGAQTLVSDIFAFYDTDTAVLDLLPKYITDENIRLTDRLRQDLDDVDWEALTDSKALDELIGRMTKENLEDIRALLDDYDTLQGLDRQKLETLLDDALSLVQQMQRSQQQVQTLKALAAHAGELSALMKSLDDPELAQMLTPETLTQALNAVAKSQVEDVMLQQTGTNASRLLEAESTLLGGTMGGYAADVKVALGMAAANGSLPQDQYQLLLSLVDRYDAVSGTLLSQLSGGNSLPAEGITMAPAAPSQPEEPQQPEESEELVPGESDTQPLAAQGDALPALSLCSAGEPEDAEATGWTLGGEPDEDFAHEEEDLPEEDEDLPEEEEDLPKEEEDLPEENEDLPQEDETPSQEGAGTPDEEPAAQEAAPFAAANQLASQPAPQAVPGDKTVCQAMVTVVDGVRRSLDQKAEEEASAAAAPTLQKVQKLLDSISALKAGIAADLGEDPQKKLQEAEAFVEQMVPALQKLMDEAQALGGGKGMEQLLEDSRQMLDHLDANRDNIRALQRVLADLDDGQLEELSRVYPDLKDDLEDVRPIMESLQDDLDDPVMDASLHNAPETTSVLLDMKDDLLSNRQVSEILRKSVRPDGVPTARRMFDTLDELMADGSVDEYTRQANDLDQLLARKDAYLDLAEEYRIYTDAAPEADTSVTFVMRTDEISQPEAPEQETEDTKPAGFWQSCKDAAAALWADIKRFFGGMGR